MKTFDDKFEYESPKYGLYLVDPSDISDDDTDDFGYDYVINLAIASYEADTKGELLDMFIEAINQDKCSDIMYYFLLDKHEGIILSKIPFDV